MRLISNETRVVAQFRRETRHAREAADSSSDQLRAHIRIRAAFESSRRDCCAAYACLRIGQTATRAVVELCSLFSREVRRNARALFATRSVVEKSGKKEKKRGEKSGCGEHEDRVRCIGHAPHLRCKADVSAYRAANFISSPSARFPSCASRHAEAPSASPPSASSSNSNNSNSGSSNTGVARYIAHHGSRASSFLTGFGRQEGRWRWEEKRTKGSGTKEKKSERDPAGNRECEMYRRIPVLVLRRF